MLKAQSISNYSNVYFQQSPETPHILHIIQPDQWNCELEIGRFNFHTKEGYLLLLNGTRKEYTRFQPLMNNFFKFNPMFGWDSGTVESAQLAGKEVIKAEKVAAIQKEREFYTNKANTFLTNLINKDQTTISGLSEKVATMDDSQLLEIINNTFKNCITKQLATDILNTIKSILNATNEPVEVVTTEVNTNYTNYTNTDETTYAVGNRTFSTYSAALEYCTTSDFDPELMIQSQEPDNTQVPSTQPVEVFYYYNQTFDTYMNAYDHAIRNYSPVTMVLSSLHPTMTNERLMELEKEYTFSKHNMVISDMIEYFEYISTLPDTLDKEDRYYKLRGWIQRHENKQQSIKESKELLDKQSIELEQMLNDMYSIGMIKKDNIYSVSYYLNDEKIYSWSSGIPIEKMYKEFKQVYNSYYNNESKAV